MVKELVARARLEAERASPPVRVAAKLRIARLESATDRSAARWTNAVTAYLFTLARVHFGEQAPVLCATSRLLRGNDS
jgi:hypothetical protein